MKKKIYDEKPSHYISVQIFEILLPYANTSQPITNICLLFLIKDYREYVLMVFLAMLISLLGSTTGSSCVHMRSSV